jgi:membrane-bound ClpP family serine protease
VIVINDVSERLDMINLFSRHEKDPPIEDADSNFQEAIVVRDIQPGRSGQILVAGGIYWKAKTKDADPIKEGEMARILKRKSTTMWVTKTTDQ